MKCIFVEFDETELEFFLHEDEIDQKMEKKLNKLGAPEIWVHFPESSQDEFTLVKDNIYQQGEFRCRSLALTETTEGAVLKARYQHESKSILVQIKGRIFSYNDPEIYEPEPDEIDLQSVSCGFIQIITAKNDKNKVIKKPKDEYGMSTPLEALAANTSYDGTGYKVTFRVTIEEGMYQDGEILTDY